MGAMKTTDDVSAEKLRGGFYSPDTLVDVCLDRVLELLDGRDLVKLLEPSVGDGAFIRGLARHPVGQQVSWVTAVEVVPEEALLAACHLERAAQDGRIVTASVLDESTLGEYHDVAVGNPPFVRFQFLSETDRAHIDGLGSHLGVTFTGVSNLWIPVFLAALSNLRDGGVFSFIVPAECFTGLSGRVVRSWLAQHATGLRVDLFPPKSFPGVLQEVVVLSGQVARGTAHGVKVFVFDHEQQDSWSHLLDECAPTWTGLLLRPDHLEAVSAALSLPGVFRFGSVAKMSVSTVTGANAYFCIDDATRTLFQLEGWTRPLLDRARHAPGLCYSESDQSSNLAKGHPVWLLDSSLAKTPTPGALAYVSNGEASGLDTRYKTRIRSPWWQVPVVPPGTLMMSKRSNRYPRLIHNEVSAATTDTVYQGRPLEAFAGRERDIVGSFHNSLTLLTAELNGRSFGGGVLELVPSEIASLAVPLATITDANFATLDSILRGSSADSCDLVEFTDGVLIEELGLDRDMWRLITEAQGVLVHRRVARN
ncbi:MAG: SAM-dependent methyltransferase [Actinomycetota bacterium]|nr:SAM-dependent methyltransferase [Actinomycetota bacterium]